MASIFLRLVKGNLNNPGIDEGISIHSFIGALDAWERGEISRADVIASFSLTAGDEPDLDQLKAWYNAATDQKLFIKVMKDRLYMAEDKSAPESGSPDIIGGLNGHFGYAIKNNFLNGADGSTPLSGL